MSLLESGIFDDQSELTQKIYKDVESILGCAQEIDCLIEYFQGSQSQLINIGLNKLFAQFNQSNLMHLEIKQQQESTNTNKQSILGVKNESIQITLEVQKQINNKQIQQTLNYYIDKNLAQFNIPYQLDLIELEQFNQYSKELLQDLFYSDEQIQNQFIQRKSIQKESTFLRRSLSLKQQTSIKSVILEKIEYRKSTMLNKLERRFPKLASLEPIIPYMLGIYVNIESEGLIGDFQHGKDQLKSIHHTVFTQSFNNFLQILSTEYVKLLVKLDLQQFIIGNFQTQFQIQFDKILTQQKWTDYDKSMIKQLLLSSMLNEQFQVQSQKLEQLDQIIKTLNQQIILIFQQIIPHEHGGFDNNFQYVEQLLQELEQEKNQIIGSQIINEEIVMAYRKVIQQILKIINKFQAICHSKFGLKTLSQMKLVLQDNNNNKRIIKQKQINEYQYKCISDLENEIQGLFKKNIVFVSSELICLIIESINKNQEFESVLSDLKYGNQTQMVICEIQQIQEFIKNDQIKQFLQNVIDYLQDRIKKKDIKLNLTELQLSQQDEQILKCINNYHMIKYVKENRKLFKIISNYILANDPFTNLTLRQYSSLQSAIEISMLAIKFSKESGLNEFFRLFFNFQMNRDSQQIKLQSQLNSSELQEWKNILQLFE